MNQDPGSRDLLTALRHVPVVGIIRAADPAAAAQHVDRMVALGLEAVEVSMSTPGALQVIADAVSRTRAGGASTSSVLIGVGTIMDVPQLHASIDAGATFVVTPTTDPEVVAAAVERGVPIIPGAATPTEIQRAVSAGATAVKLFPASLWSTGAFRDLRTVFPEVAFVPTGGVGAEDAPGWLAAGATAVGMGSALTSGEVDVAQLLAELKGIAS